VAFLQSCEPGGKVLLVRSVIADLVPAWCTKFVEITIFIERATAYGFYTCGIAIPFPTLNRSDSFRGYILIYLKFLEQSFSLAWLWCLNYVWVIIMSPVLPALHLQMFLLSIEISLVLCPAEFYVQFRSFPTPTPLFLRIALKVLVAFQIYL